MEVFNQAVSAISNDIDMHILMSISKFGQKDDQEFNLGALVHVISTCHIMQGLMCLRWTHPLICFGPDLDFRRLWEEEEMYSLCTPWLRW